MEVVSVWLCRCRNIFSIQQCLTNITSNRESDLDHARQYYELLYLPPDVSPLLVLFCRCYCCSLQVQFHGARKRVLCESA